MDRDKRDEKDKVLRELAAENGTLTPHIVFEAAKAIEHPLHSCGFIWDHDEAWITFNLDVAKKLIRSVRAERRVLLPAAFVESAEADDVGIPTKTAQTFRREAGGGYRMAEAPAIDAFAVVADGIQRAHSLLRNTHAFATSIGFGNEVDDFAERLLDLRERVMAAGQMTPPDEPGAAAVEADEFEAA